MAVRRGGLYIFWGGDATLLLLYFGGWSLLSISVAGDCIAEYRGAAMMPTVFSDRFPSDKKLLLSILTNLQEKTCFRFLFRKLLVEP